MKFCSKCKIEKLVVDFNKDKNRPDGHNYICRDCSKITGKSYRNRNIDKVREKSRLDSKKAREAPDFKKKNKTYRNTIAGTISHLRNNAQTRAKKKNVEFDLPFQDLLNLWNKQNGLCALSGQIMTHTKLGGGRRTPNAASIDRIVPALGYTISNVRFVCIRVNEMKSDGSDEDLAVWITRIWLYSFDKTEAA